MSVDPSWWIFMSAIQDDPYWWIRKWKGDKIQYTSVLHIPSRFSLYSPPSDVTISTVVRQHLYPENLGLIGRKAHCIVRQKWYNIVIVAQSNPALEPAGQLSGTEIREPISLWSGVVLTPWELEWPTHINHLEQREIQWPERFYIYTSIITIIIINQLKCYLFIYFHAFNCCQVGRCWASSGSSLCCALLGFWTDDLPNFRLTSIDSVNTETLQPYIVFATLFT